MTTLTEFLLARIADMEEYLRLHLPSGINGTDQAFAECEAKRRIVELADSDELFDGDILRALALPYADHPDYDEEWKP